MVDDESIDESNLDSIEGEVAAADQPEAGAEKGEASGLEGDQGDSASNESDGSQALAETAKDADEDDEEDSSGEEEKKPASELNYLDDELEEAYDFESGELISDDPHAGIPTRNIVQTAREFFNTEILYRFDILEDSDRDNLKGAYQLEISGESKETWSVELKEDIEVKNQSTDDAEVTLRLSERDFVMLVNGDLNPQLALLSEKIKVAGSLEKAFEFQNILAPNAD